MNGSIRVSAKTVDDAITEALIQLGVTSDKLEYEVIEKGSAGFLGIGMKQAVIEARRKPEEAAEEPDITFDFSLDEKKEPKKEIKKDTKKEKKDVKAQTEVQKETVKEKAEERKNSETEETEKAPAKREIVTVRVTEEAKSAVEGFLADTLKAMGMEVELTSVIEEDGSLTVDMKGENMGILIGKRGQTLDSLQYLANRVANKHQDGYVRVKLDTENYRARREETLKHLAKNIAHKVKRNRRPVALEPMNPYERRIIHSALQSDPYVTTHSEGEEPYRKVVVTLKR
jgi:spoIIIJ-associated protein